MVDLHILRSTRGLLKRAERKKIEKTFHKSKRKKVKRNTKETPKQTIECQSCLQALQMVVSSKNTGTWILVLSWQITHLLMWFHANTFLPSCIISDYLIDASHLFHLLLKKLSLKRFKIKRCCLKLS